MRVALSLLLMGNRLVPLDAIGVAATADIGNRIGLATLLMLISLVGGRIIPSFTRNWLTKNRPEVSPPRPESQVDHAILGVTALVLVGWTFPPDAVVTAWGTIVAGSATSSSTSRSFSFFMSAMAGLRPAFCCLGSTRNA